MLANNLLRTLEVVSPALGRADISQQLAHLWFDGTNVTAFDDSVAITTACDIPIKGGVPGGMLTSLLGKHSKNREVIVVQEDSVLHIAIGKLTRAKLPLMDYEQRSFDMSDSKPDAVVKFNKASLESALTHCVKCAGQDTSKPEYFGISFETGLFEDAVGIYSGDTRTLVEAIVPIKKGSKPQFKKVILPVKFCQQVIKYLPHNGSTLEICEGSPGYALLKTDYVTVYGRNMLTEPTEGDSTPDFFKRALETAVTFMPMPPIDKILERAALLDENRDNLNLSVVKLTDGKCRLKFNISKEAAELTDSSIPVKSKHEAISVRTSVKNIKHGASLQEININSQYIVMRTMDDALDIVQLVGVEA